MPLLFHRTFSFGKRRLVRSSRAAVLRILWGVALMGCSHSSSERWLPALVGTYSYGAFDLSRHLMLGPDSTYRETEVGPLIVLGPKGEVPPPKVRDHGRFVVSAGQVVLYSASGTQRILQKVDGPNLILRERAGGRPRDYIREKSKQEE